MEADLFDLPDGPSLSVASPEDMGVTERSLGFLVDDIDAAVQDLRAAGGEVEADFSGNARARDVHFRRRTDSSTSSSSAGQGAAEPR